MKRQFDYLTAVMAAAALGCLVLLSGCGPQDDEVVAAASRVQTGDAQTQSAQPPIVSFHLGEVRHIETLTERPKATGVGAVGGAVLGNKIERDRAETVVGYRIEVRLDNGELRHFQRTQLDGLRVGKRVRIDGDSLRLA